MLLQLVLLFLLPASSHPFLFPNTSHLIAPSGISQCNTGNPIDDCWLCSPTDWRNDLYRLADCSIGFGRSALGGKNGRIYTVTDPSDSDPSNPIPGTLRHAAIQTSPLWIIFAADMSIHLNEELLVNSYKTLDGRGATVHITGGGCIIIRNVSNVIVHNLHIHDCVPGGKAEIRSSPTEEEIHGKSDGDGITILASQDVWVDHCSLSSCTDGLIDVTRGSTRVTISNNFFSNHDKVMLLGHSDDYTADTGMQVTIAFNKFGEKLVQRMPRCRHGYFHVVNNDYTGWEMYAVGGSANPTVNCQGNRFTAPGDPNFKEVTKRIHTEEDEWRSWNWRSEGDVMLNGAFFVTSGDGSPANYEKASSFEALSADLVDQITRNVGVLILPSISGGRNASGGGDDSSGGGGGDDGDHDGSDGGDDSDIGGGGDRVNGSLQYPGMMYEGGAPSSPFDIQLFLPLFITIFIIIFSSR